MTSLLAEYFGFNTVAFRTASGLPSDIQWLVAVWIMMVGGCIGSLMNVIVYRWPAGMSIVLPGSRCPRCLHPIRLYDNVPVFSWLALRARCRDCKAPIAVRYPTIEAAVALMFFGLFVVEVIYDASNLPAGQAHQHAQTAAQVKLPRPLGLLWGTFALHIMLCCTVICAALIALDAHRLPAKLIWPPLLIAILVTILWPQLRPLADISAVDSGRRWSVGFYDGVAGIALAGFGGGILDLLLPARLAGRRRTLSATAVAVVVGAILGWMAALQICAVTALLALAAEVERLVRPRVRTLPVAVYLSISTLLFLLYWRLMERETQWLTDRGEAVTMIASLIFIGAVAGAAGLIRSHRESK